MFADQIPSSIVISVIVVALVAGTACMATSNIVWFKNQVFGVGGSILSFCGLVLIGLSVWGNVQFEGAGIKINLQSLVQDNPELAGEVISQAIEESPELGEQFFKQVAIANPTFVQESPKLAEIVLNRAIERNPELGDQFFKDVAVTNPTLVADRMLMLAESDQRVYRSLSSRLSSETITNFERQRPIVEEPANGEIVTPEARRLVPTL